MKKALIFQGGWDGHQPILVSERFKKMLEKNYYEVEVVDNHDRFDDMDYLRTLDLLVACWTMGDIKWDHTVNLSKVIGEGLGIAGCHGGMCDSFRNNTEWQFITGGQWVSHPGGDGIEYTVNISSPSNPITEGMSDFLVKSEHYYLHIDPAIEVLATTRFPQVPYYHISNKPVEMPVAWTKMWGNGRVFYTSLGHHDDVFDNSPNAQILMERGLVWAGNGKQYVKDNNLSVDRFMNDAKMY